MRKLLGTLAVASGLAIAVATGAFASEFDDFDDDGFDDAVSVVPEPTAFLLMGLGFGTIAIVHRLRRP
jgi:hypothetical protein